ncbi:hypothetical protein SORDD24_00977 [Streptococcus oralis]|uniref:DUF1868 domain-containing protein n=1 Tax=Streptococcus oralis TaxID=1303 RepID=A0A139QR13_STROR|nr:hypothetical protein SORDD24_00977 [Streptococcus oralis]
MEPANSESSQRLKEIRDYIAEKTGVRFANHNSYQFHISIGYVREPLTEVEKQLFDGVRARLTQLLLEKLPLISIERIEFTVFEDMRKFVPYLPKEK